MLILRGTLVLSFGLLILSPAPSRAQNLDFRNPEQAPPSWAQFAKLVKYRFEEWVAADETVANRFRNWVIENSGKENGPPPTLVVRAWLNPDGTVERVDRVGVTTMRGEP